MSNAAGEWPVAYHGVRTTPQAATPAIVAGGLLPGRNDAYLNEAVRMNPLLANTPSIYCTPVKDVATGYTSPISIQTRDRGVLRYRIIFMCRVNPAFFTEHLNRTYWRESNPDGIRPYGLLIKLEI
jgi:hypothetical protein